MVVVDPLPLGMAVAGVLLLVCACVAAGGVKGIEEDHRVGRDPDWAQAEAARRTGLGRVACPPTVRRAAAGVVATTTPAVADLLAEVAGLLERADDGEPDEPLNRQAAGLCRKARTDPEAIPVWIEEGRRHGPPRMPPPAGGLRGG